MLIDMPSMGMFFARMQGSINKFLEFGLVVLGDLIEVNQLSIYVVYYLASGRLFGKEDGTPSAEGFCIKFVLWNQRKYMFQQSLLSAIIGYGCFHYRILIFMTIIKMHSSMSSRTIYRITLTEDGADSSVSDSTSLSK